METRHSCFSHSDSFSAEVFPLMSFRGTQTFCTDCSLSSQRAWQQDGERPPLGRKEVIVTSWPSLESDHQQPLHTPLSF